MCSRRLQEYLQREQGDVKRIFASAGRLGQGTYGVVYKVRHGSRAAAFAHEREEARKAEQAQWYEAAEARRRAAQLAREDPQQQHQQQQQQAQAQQLEEQMQVPIIDFGLGTSSTPPVSSNTMMARPSSWSAGTGSQEAPAQLTDVLAHNPAPMDTAAEPRPHSVPATSASATSTTTTGTTTAAPAESGSDPSTEQDSGSAPKPAASGERKSGLPPISHPSFSIFVSNGSMGRSHKRGKHLIPYGSCPRYDDTDRDPQRWYALKAMQAPTTKNLDVSVPALREFSLLRELKHKNIIMIKDTFLRPTVDPKQIWILFEYATFDLWYLLQTHRKEKGAPLPEAMQLSIMHQLCSGMAYLHDHWIIHRDLKPGNILITSYNDIRPGVVKLADFGLARLCSAPPKPLARVDPIVVTYWYRAPELLLGTEHYTRAIDMWALGCIMAELVTLRPLFHVAEDQKTKDPYFKEQLAAIAQVLGVAMESEWQMLTELPKYPNYSSDSRKFKTPTCVGCCVTIRRRD
ncbi:CMGC/CDK/CDK8 protein kinase [Salpingoeca rosetta]|uniref:CMGC/CDK/CDK8 protein kinase n=1 Tax=Salpingoeca rosetta (strain ATCC 50818 / BSB-021) TaxID=946362 RepID=F2TVM4_SALR5|nr:CMGC/CDK/CDK8 protein kinase [Salpingoeca rosetta]EGD72120.1 CMGC/CDK/CDK8 protein kinase [Salpingoeca rosetta]|eukprot:XP_004998692.1 CMGC/CDK/CDK8 protein kinase [Salpingoeca rosetta]